MQSTVLPNSHCNNVWIGITADWHSQWTPLRDGLNPERNDLSQTLKHPNSAHSVRAWESHGFSRGRMSKLSFRLFHCSVPFGREQPVLFAVVVRSVREPGVSCGPFVNEPEAFEQPSRRRVGLEDVGSEAVPSEKNVTVRGMCPLCPL